MIPPKTIERQIEDAIETDIDAAEEREAEQMEFEEEDNDSIKSI